MRSLHEIEAHGFRNKEGSELGLTVSHGKVSMATNTWVYNAEKNNQNKAGVAIAETNKTGRKAAVQTETDAQVSLLVGTELRPTHCGAIAGRCFLKMYF